MIQRFDVSPLSSVERTPQGGYRVKAALTRVGVFKYDDGKGGTIAEYRPPEEVFSSASLQTFPDAPVTVGHPGMVTPDNHGQHAQGHVRDVKQDGDRVEANLVIQGARAIKAIERGTRQISVGYVARIDETPGVTPNGEPYQRIQRDIRVNHCALVDVGRAGPDIRLRLDAAGNQIEGSRGMYRTDDTSADMDAMKARAFKAAGQEFDTAGMSPAEMMYEAVKLARPDLDLAGTSTHFVEGVFAQLLAGRKDSADARLDDVEAAAARMAERNRNAWRGDTATQTRTDERRDGERNHQLRMMELHAEHDRRKRLAAQELRHDTAGSDYAQRKAEMDKYVAEANQAIAEQMATYNAAAWREPSPLPGETVEDARARMLGWNDQQWKQASGQQSMPPNAMHKPGDQGGK